MTSTSSPPLLSDTASSPFQLAPAVLLDALAPAAVAAQDVAIRNATILTITNGTIENGTLVVRDGKIAAVGTAVSAPQDADVIVTYVRLGLGVGIVAPMAVAQDADDLVVLDASHLLPRHTSWLGFRRGTLLRKYMYDFAHLLAPHLERRLVERAHRAASPEETAALFADVKLPQR